MCPRAQRQSWPMRKSKKQDERERQRQLQGIGTLIRTHRESGKGARGIGLFAVTFPVIM